MIYGVDGLDLSLGSSVYCLRGLLSLLGEVTRIGWRAPIWWFLGDEE